MVTTKMRSVNSGLGDTYNQTTIKTLSHYKDERPLEVSFIEEPSHQKNLKGFSE
jgi:hypothetical protein